MRLKFGLAALLVSISILLLQSNSFSTAELRNDLALSVVEEKEALIAITEWEGRVFTLVNNTETNVEIDSITMKNDNWLGVEEELSMLAPGEKKKFTLLGEDLESSGGEVLIVAKWEAGRAEILTEMPKMDVVVNRCIGQPNVNQVTVNEVEDVNLQEQDEEGVKECTKQPELEGEAVNDEEVGGTEDEVEDIPDEEEENEIPGGITEEIMEDGESAPPK